MSKINDPESETQSESVLLRLKPSEKAGFTEAAQIAGAPLAVWMRERLRAVATEELAKAGRKSPFIKPITVNNSNE